MGDDETCRVSTLISVRQTYSNKIKNEVDASILQFSGNSVINNSKQPC